MKNEPSPAELVPALTFRGSARRIWRVVRTRRNRWARWLLGVVAVPLTVLAWAIVLLWYVFNLWLDGEGAS